MEETVLEDHFQIHLKDAISQGSRFDVEMLKPFFIADFHTSEPLERNHLGRRRIPVNARDSYPLVILE
jgi:hypothetical protein